MKGSYLPPAIRGEMLATENFFYTARFLGLPERATIQELADAGERVCGAEWTPAQGGAPQGSGGVAG